MVHLFFQRIAVQSGMANVSARVASETHANTRLWFSNIFSIFFPPNGHFENKVDTWLNAVSERFAFPEENASPLMRREVEILFQRLGIQNIHSTHNIGVFQFWLFLVWIYKQLLCANYNRNDNLFQFMRGFSIYETKVVIMGNYPAKDVHSSGYAFHGSQCPSTEQILDFLEREMGQVSSYLNDYSLAISLRDLNIAKGKCNLNGWIKQGVLLLNSCPTYFNGGSIYDGWKFFTDFIIRYLSDEVRNVVFLFLGGMVADKARLVDCNNGNNLVINLYHPARYTYLPQRPVSPDLDWATLLPFLNANFYFYQIQREEGLIDWKSIERFKPGKNGRLHRLSAFFSNVLRIASYNQNYQDFQLSNQFLVRKDENNLLYLELMP